jgi:hypothetical protein
MGSIRRRAVVRSWRSDGQSLRDLDWLIGTWKVKRDDVEVLTTYTWDAKKVFIKSRFTIKDKNGTTTGTQIIGKDPSTGAIRSWTFESEGGFGEAAWSRDGKRWVMEAKGVQADGSKLTATNILTRINDDTFTWQTVDRTRDEEELNDVPPIRVTRVTTVK